MFGTWKMDVSRSKITGSAPPKSFTVRAEPHAKGEVFTLDRGYVGLGIHVEMPLVFSAVQGFETPLQHRWTCFGPLDERIVGAVQI